jgi:GDP-mannose 6-dehydrogenase
LRVTVFGLGYVGSVTAAALARDGHRVIGVDPVQHKLEAMRAGRAPVLEPGMDAVVSQAVHDGRLQVTADPGVGMEGAEISLICVGTPTSSQGEIDLSHVRLVSRQIGEHLGKAAPGHVVVLRSTVVPGTSRNLMVPEIEKTSGRKVGEGWDACFNPEFLREGSSLQDYDRPSRVLVGERSAGVGQRVLQLYEKVEAPRFVSTLEVAETVKYADNAFHALKITFANEVGRVCDALDIDGNVVMEIFRADHKLNVSPVYLRPGYAFGGSCLPKDLRALTFTARRAGVTVPMLESILPSNEIAVRRAVDAVLETGLRRVALLGLAFKPGTDDLRESPLVELAERLIGKGFELRVHDPDVALGRLHGSNRAFLQEKLPHVDRLLLPTVDEAVKPSQVVVIGHSGARFAQDEAWRSQGKVVLRLA